MRRLLVLQLLVVACAPPRDDKATTPPVVQAEPTPQPEVATPEQGPVRVTLRAGSDIVETALVLETAKVFDLPPHSPAGRDYGPADLVPAVAQVLSIGSGHDTNEKPVQLCPRGRVASIDAVRRDDADCEWSSRWYFGANVGGFPAELITAAALVEDSDGTRYRIWIADGTYADGVLELTLDVERLVATP